MASRREFLAVAGVSALGGCSGLLKTEEPADTLIVNGRIATLDPKQPNAEAIAIRGERIVAVGNPGELERDRGPSARGIAAGRRSGIPGRTAARAHVIRGGLTYTNEVRWDGVPSLAEGMR